MSNLLLPLLPGTLPTGWCPTTEQERLNEYAAHLEALLEAGSVFYNYGDTKPAPEYQGYPWLRSIDMRWYKYDGDWISPHPITDTNAIQLWKGSAVDLQTFDGGDANTASDRSGPMWQIYTAAAGRVPIAPGVLAGSGLTINVTDTGGADRVSPTSENIPPHWHYIGVEGDSDIADQTSINGRLRVGAGTEVDWQDIATVKVGKTRDNIPNGGSAVVPINLMNPYIGLYLIQRTARLYYRVP